MRIPERYIEKLPVLERVVQLLEGVTGRVRALTFALIGCWFILGCALYIILSASSQLGAYGQEIAGHQNQYEQQGSASQKRGVASVNCKTDDGCETDTEKSKGDDRSQMISLAQLRESVIGNQLAARYNEISFDAAISAKVGGAVVVVLGIVSTIGVMVAIFAASDARRAIDIGLLAVEAQRRSTRAVIGIVADGSGYLPLRMKNFGGTPARVHSVRIVDLGHGLEGHDPSVMTWLVHADLSGLVASGKDEIIEIPFVGMERPYGLLAGIVYEDVHGDQWCSWCHLRANNDNGGLMMEGSGEFRLE